jgi:CheY-like chemotaxis protein
MDALVRFVQSNKPLFETVQAVGAVVNLLGWMIGFLLLFIAWRRRGIQSVSVGPVQFQLQQAAIEATATAARDWQARTPDQSPKVDVERIRSTVSRAFDPAIADRLMGKSVLWVDDAPKNNELAVRALRRIQLDVEQVVSTEAAIKAMAERHFDVIISDMGRAGNPQAGYELLAAVRQQSKTLPFLIFSSGDKPEFRKAAADHGAQLSTNDMMELVDTVIRHLGEGAR